MRELLLVLALSAIIIICTGFVAYWAGRDSGSKEAFEWKSKYEGVHRDFVLLEQRANGMRHELDEFYPKSVWGNHRYVSDESGS